MDEAALLGLQSLGDVQSQQQAAQYFEQLKQSDQGWQQCANALSSGVYYNNDHAKFFCFQVIEHYVKTGYVVAGPEVQHALKSFLMGWLQQSCGQAPEKSFLRNKAAQIFSLVFLVDYPRRWASLLTDVIQTLPLGEAAVDIYLRILMAIDSEVVDREIVHTSQETERNISIKDTMRQQCVQQLVDSWYHIMTQYESYSAGLTCLCLDVVGAYVSWIDINLIANDRFVPVLLRFMGLRLLRESACDCIHEIINKGMDPLSKTKLIESFIKELEGRGLLVVTEDEEGDYLAKLAKLVNGIGLQLIAAWRLLLKSKDIESAKIPLTALEQKVPLMFKFLRNEDDDVSGTVTQFAHDYISVLKQISTLSSGQKQNLKELMYIIIEKMKYDESYSFDHEGEEEAMFQEYRKELKIIFKNLGALDSDLLVSAVHSLVGTTLQGWRDASYQELELAISMFYMLGEALPVTHAQPFTSENGKTTAMQQIMQQLVTSGVSSYNHPAVVAQFFETVVRYDKFFNVEPQHIPEVLIAFLDERGLRSNSAHIRSRSSYLFSRFVKAIGKAHIHAYLDEILGRIQDLLVLNTPDNGLKHYLTADDQLFIYETAGILIVQSPIEPHKKLELMQNLLSPVVTHFQALLQQMVAEADPDRQQGLADTLTQAMAFASRASKGFSTGQTMKQCGCVQVYTNTLSIFLQALDTPIHRAQLQGGVRQFLHRMVVCLDEEVMPYVPAAMENLLKNPDAKELYDFLPLVNQVVQKFKAAIVPFLVKVFLPIVRTVFRVLAAPSDERDQVAATERRLLQRGYFSFIATLVNNDVAQVLANQERSSLHQVLLTVIQGAVDVPDPPAQKICFSILNKLIGLWGSKEGLSGFEDFIYKSVVPACFEGPTKMTFDLCDAQTVLVLHEVSSCLKAAHTQRGDELLLFLQNDFLPKLNVNPTVSQEFCQALKSDPKSFRNYFKGFIKRAKS